MSTPSAASSTTSTQTGKYLTVVLENEAYGIAVLKVREIIRLQKITPVPQVPEFVKGVINLRGRVIPIVDLRSKFGLKAEFTERTCIVVVQVALESSNSVHSTTENWYHNGGVRIDTSYILGMAKIKGQVKTLLDIDRVVAPETVRAMSQAAA